MQFPDIVDLIPHRGRSVLVDRVVEFRPERVVCAVEIRPGHFYEAGGSVRAAATLEMMAQTAAAHLGLSQHERGDSEGHGAAPRVPALRDGAASNSRAGYVIAVRGFRVQQTVIPMGAALQIGATLTRSDRKSAVFDCWVESDDRRVAEVTLTVYRP